MRSYSLLLLVLALASPLLGQGEQVMPFRLEFDSVKGVQLLSRDAKGKEGVFIKVKFTITLQGDKVDDQTYKVVIEEEGRRVLEKDVPRPTPTDDLSVILAVDTSGSMKEHQRMAKAKAAAGVFFDLLPPTAECGLILFSHELRPPIQPTLDRGILRQAVDSAEPAGGTAYLDAAARGIELLAKIQGKERALVLMTDGVDLNSKVTLDQVIAKAKQAKVKVYTIGIGEPGKNETVNSVLVLDKSGSMTLPADDQDRVPKITALKRAAARFLASLGPTGRCSILEFSDQPVPATPFTNDRFRLKAKVDNLSADGETAVFDATYAAIATLEAERPVGSKAVVALTDGIDNASRRRVEEVIARAKEAKIPLYMLGFGRPGELDQEIMEKMANDTGGKYYHAKNEQALMAIFENLSIQLHDDGIDEDALRKLADHTGGTYYHARDVSQLNFIVSNVTKGLQKKDYEETFPSLRQVHDGTARRVAVKLVRRSGELASNTAESGSAVPRSEVTVAEKSSDLVLHGVVVPGMHYLVYLGVLGVLAFLLVVPGMLRRRPAG